MDCFIDLTYFTLFFTGLHVTELAAMLQRVVIIIIIKCGQA